MAGARTVDSAAINWVRVRPDSGELRLKNGLAGYNLRVIVSGSGSLNPARGSFQTPFLAHHHSHHRRASKAKLLQLQAIADEVKICGRREINFRAALRWLREKWGVKRLLCEGGGELNDALFRAGLVDELHLTICPKIFGGRHAPTIADGRGFEPLAAAAQFRLKSLRHVNESLIRLRSGIHNSAAL
jgi:riboflavin biosynthesis pyrimidine reductase